MDIPESELHEPGVVCVDCSHPDNVEWQKQVFHPAYRKCVLRMEQKVEPD